MADRRSSEKSDICEEPFLSDNENDLPEELSFSECKQLAALKQQQITEQIKTFKQEEKKKRKRLDQKYKEQKRKKLEAVPRLPEDIINGLERKPSMRFEKQVEEVVEKVPHADSNGNNDDECNILVKEKDDKSFIPFSDKRYGGIAVVSLSDSKKNQSFLGGDNFRQKRLYGGHIPRVHAKEKQAQIEKRRARHNK